MIIYCYIVSISYELLAPLQEKNKKLLKCKITVMAAFPAPLLAWQTYCMTLIATATCIHVNMFLFHFGPAFLLWYPVNKS